MSDSFKEISAAKWAVERQDRSDGEIVYEIWTANGRQRIARVDEDHAKALAELIVKEHNR